MTRILVLRIGVVLLVGFVMAMWAPGPSVFSDDTVPTREGEL